MCGIPISNESEKEAIQAIYDEVHQNQEMPYRFSEKTRLAIPRHPLSYFVFAKLRGAYTREWEPELFCRQCLGSSYDYRYQLPRICNCNACREDEEEEAVQKPVMTPEQRQEQQFKRKATSAIHTPNSKRQAKATPAFQLLGHEKPIEITPELRQRIQANRERAFAIQARNKQVLERKKDPGFPSLGDEKRIHITPEQRQRKEANRLKALAIQARNKRMLEEKEDPGYQRRISSSPP